jgi:hypothetical protein
VTQIQIGREAEQPSAARVSRGGTVRRVPTWLADPEPSRTMPRSNLPSRDLTVPGRGRRWGVLRFAAIVAATLAALLSVVLAGVGTDRPSATSHVAPSAMTAYPTGAPNRAEPSGEAPPSARALPGYTLRYETDFSGTALPAGWDAFSGVPGGTPDGQFSPAHAVVAGGLLSLNSWRDPAYANRWVTGGVCLCSKPQTYGAYFVRSRLTGAGPNEIQLLWPASNTWPPEIDFSESGATTTGTAATVHYGAGDNTEQHSVAVDLTKWHTFGVVWRPGFLAYTLDGAVWGTVDLAWQVPDQPMTLHVQQQSSCVRGFSYWCQKKPVSMEIDWVAQYAQSPTSTEARAK